MSGRTGPWAKLDLWPSKHCCCILNVKVLLTFVRFFHVSYFECYTACCLPTERGSANNCQNKKTKKIMLLSSHVDATYSFRLFSFQNSRPAFCRSVPYIELLSRHSPAYSLAASILRCAISSPGSWTLCSCAIAMACRASLIAKDTPNPGRESRGGA